MLEESAAQLAALRQRAEELLEQLATDREPVPGVPSSNQDPPTRPDDSAPSEHHADDPAPVQGEPPHGVISQNPFPNDQDPGLGSTPEGPIGGNDSVQWGKPPSPGKDLHQNADSLPALSDQNRLPSPDPQTSLDDTPYAETIQDAALLSNSLSQNFPLQHAQPQSQSLLDAPVTAVPPFDWNRVQVASDPTPTDVHMIEEEIISLYEAIDHVRETRGENTGHALALLREAREIIAGQPNGIERAEYNIQDHRSCQVQSQPIHRYRSENGLHALSLAGRTRQYRRCPLLLPARRE